jgi:hypothetical protein
MKIRVYSTTNPNFLHGPKYFVLVASFPPWPDAARNGAAFYEAIKNDDLVNRQQNDGFIKSSRCQARKN